MNCLEHSSCNPKLKFHPKLLNQDILQDIGRTMMLNSFPKHRLDAGSFGTMGVGLGFAIAAALYAKENCPEKRIICVEGDSAFGFSGMEMETIVRYKIVEVYNS